MRALVLAREDLRITLRDRSAIFWMFIAPFLFVFLFGHLAGSSSGSRAQVSLTVIQQDDSALAERLVELLRVENFNLTVIPPGEAVPEEKALTRSLTIPAGFADSIAAREEVTLDLRVHSDNAHPDATIAAEVALHRATVRLLAGEVFGESDPGKDAVTLKSSWARKKKTPTGYYLTVPGYLVMFVVLSTLTYGAAGLATERKNGQLARLATSPLSRGEILLGKLLGRGAIAAVQTAFFIILGLTLFRIDWGSSPLGLVAVLLSLILCTSALSFLSGTLFKSPDAAAGIGVVLALAMSALGGCWWPAEVMPRWLQTASHVFPTTWAVGGLHQIISWEGGLLDVLLPSAVLLLFALAAGILGTRLLRFSG